VPCDFEEYSRKHRGDVEGRLDELLPGPSERPERLHEAMRYSALGGGKRFRPLLCLAAAEAVGGDLVPVLDGACAVEMVHCFSLIHDDLPALDNDDLRRGKPTCHVKFGEALALLAGDALFCLAFETLANMDAPIERRLDCVRSLARASGTRGMVGGQTVDLEGGQMPPSPEKSRWIHERKTGTLISASCEVGAILAGGDESVVELCASIGRKIGLAFQISDDILNETGDESLLGKRTKTDRELDKATYPAVVGLEASRVLAQEAIEEARRDIAAFGNAGGGLVALAEFAVGRRS
jgi:geranylgeranyl pyrophosphate synthase